MGEKVNLDITHNLVSTKFVMQTFDIGCTVTELKQKLQRITGSSPEFMQITLRGVELQEGQSLGYYDPHNGDELHVVDSDPFSVLRGLEDAGDSKKYVMSDQDYNKRKNTVRAFKAEQLRLMESKAANQKSNDTRESKIAETESQESVSARIPLSSRVKVFPGDRLGTVRFVGRVPEIPTKRGKDVIWVGVRFDEPVGSCDGSALGTRYFEAGGTKNGGFIDPAHVLVGDFPERDPFDNSDNEDLEEEL